MPHTHLNASQPTEREKEKHAQAKAAQRMLDLEAEPKPASCRGLCTPGHIKKKTAKLLVAVQVGYDKLVRAMAGGAPMEPSSSHSHSNLEDDLVPDNEGELAAKAAEAVGKDLRFEPAYGHYESSLVTKSIAAALFTGPKLVGITFQDFFDPMPLTTVAFVPANEWESGQWQPRDLSTSNMLNKYMAHLRGLKVAQSAARGRMRHLQEHWFEFGFEYSGAMPVDDPIYQPITQRSEVRPDTPISDEDDDLTAEQPTDEQWFCCRMMMWNPRPTPTVVTLRRQRGRGMLRLEMLDRVEIVAKSLY
ncbi:hypothetical protein FRC06_011216 [Ceratobasidium sp. 370]|nr:hypothetical protein FRC06_011216 [Ceratobasidium sp. 370]